MFAHSFAIAISLAIAVFGVGSCYPTSFKGSGNSASSTAEKAASLQKVMNYLKQFGYLANSTSTRNDFENGTDSRNVGLEVNVKTGFDSSAPAENDLDFSDKENLSDAIKKFQKNFGLPATGELDAEVLTEMDQPRCGVKDPSDEGIATTSAGYTYLGGRPRAWRKRHLTYRIDVYSRKLPEDAVDGEIRRAFDAWSRVTDLTFQQVPPGRRADIEIRFGAWAHSDAPWDPWFDGPGGTLAHAFGPDNGDAHFDESEPWVINDDDFGNRRGVDLFQVAVHEFGHSLGLGHSRNRAAIMFASYRQNKRRLSPDDIRGIQSLYGAKTKRETPAVDEDEEDVDDLFPSFAPTTKRPRTTTEVGPTPGQPDKKPTWVPKVDPKHEKNPKDEDGKGGGPDSLCANPKIDAIVAASDGGIYVFKGDYYWSLVPSPFVSRRRRRHLTTPLTRRLITDDWVGLPAGKVDAAFTHVSVDFGVPYAATYIFKGDKCWRFTTEGGLTRGYPKPISKVFPGIPGKLDAALQYGPQGSIYFFKGEEYWKFDPHLPVPVDVSIYPRSIKDHWHGLKAGGIDAALQFSTGRSYFFKDDVYYEYDVLTNQVLPGYPASSKMDWFGCGSSKKR